MAIAKEDYLRDVAVKIGKEFGVEYTPRQIEAALLLLGDECRLRHLRNDAKWMATAIVDHVAQARDVVQAIYRIAGQAIDNGQSVEILGRAVEA